MIVNDLAWGDLVCCSSGGVRDGAYAVKFYGDAQPLTPKVVYFPSSMTFMLISYVHRARKHCIVNRFGFFLVDYRDLKSACNLKLSA
jgi:hypothetical protein